MNIVLCSRCSQPCRISDRASNPEAQPLKLAKQAKDGLCPNCAVTAFIMSVEPMYNAVVRNGPEMFLQPHIQKGFADLFAAGNSDANIGEIDWQSVVENWDLPMPGKPKRAVQ